MQEVRLECCGDGVVQAARLFVSVAGSGADFPAPIGRDDGVEQGWGGFLREGLEDQVEDVIVAWREEGVYYLRRWMCCGFQSTE